MTFFGASRSGIFGTGGKLLGAFGLAFGFPMDPEKSVDYSILMDVLGIEVDLQWARKLVSTSVSSDKAQKWTQALAEIVETDICSPELSSKMAGRLSFVVLTTCDRAGRALVNPSMPRQITPFWDGGAGLCASLPACVGNSTYGDE